MYPALILMKTQNIIAGIGEILWDIFPEGKNLGGAPANFIYHCNIFGARGYPVSCIGNDDLGIEIRSQLENMKISHKYIIADSRYPTGTVTVKIDKDGKPDYTIRENVTWDHIPLTDEIIKLAEKTDAVCFGTLAQRSSATRNTIQKFIQTTKPSCLKICDINLRQNYYSNEIIQKSLEYSDILKLNDEEISVVAQAMGIEGDEDKMLYGLLNESSPEIIVLTKGGSGSRLVSRDEDIVCKGVKAKKIVDTVGAGDCFTAAMTVGLLRGTPLNVILDSASRIASYVCSQAGATPEIPYELTVYN